MAPTIISSLPPQHFQGKPSNGFEAFSRLSEHTEGEAHSTRTFSEPTLKC